MKSRLRVLLIAVLAFIWTAFLLGRSLQDKTSPAQPVSEARKSFVDCSSEELIARYPPLRETLNPAQDQEALSPLLAALGKNVQEFMKYFPNTACSEEILQQAHGPDGKGRRKSTRYQYVIVAYPHMVTMDEYRTDSKGSAAEIRGLSEGFMLTSGFVALPLFLHPSHQSGSRFRYIGTTTEPKCHVLAFAQVPGIAAISQEFHVIWRGKVSINFQGLIWADPASCQIMRMHTELLAPAVQIGLESSDSDLDFGPITFAGITQAFWLPREVNVRTRWGATTYQNRHRYSDYKLFTVQSFDEVHAPKPRPPE